jgi:hypothetical protein
MLDSMNPAEVPESFGEPPSGDPRGDDTDV